MPFLDQVIERYMFLVGEIDAKYRAFSARLGVSDSVMQIYYTLSLCGGSCPLSRMRQLTCLPKQTLSSALGKLEREGLVALEKTNGKQKLVTLTDAGARQAEATAGRVIAAENALFEGWSREDKERYLALTERYLADLHHQLEKGENE